MKNIILILLLLLSSTCLFGQSKSNIPEHLKHVDQTLWVVADLDQVIAAWDKLGFRQVADLGIVQAKFKSSGERLKLRMARANLGGALVTWIQPLDGISVFSQFHQEYGDGAMSLVHRLDEKQDLAGERVRLANAGVGVLEEVNIKTKKGKWSYLLTDTRGEGKYVLGYVIGEEDEQLSATLSQENHHNMRLTQYAFAAKDVDKVSPFWNQVGLPEIDVTPSVVRDKMYYGQSANFAMNLGWQRHGRITYEWCLPLQSPTVYQDHMEKHGEGIHHLGFAVSDIDAVIQDFAAKGFRVSMSGAWGEKDQPGSGRFAYIDLENAGGLTVELLWNYKAR